MNILGINCALHDISVALIRDGIVVAAIEEERLSHNKHETGIYLNGKMPKQGLQWLLKSQKLKPGALDLICVAGNIKRQPAMIMTKVKTLLQYLRELDPGLSKTIFVDHHLCHANSAFAGSDFPDALIITIDGEGDSISTAIHYADQHTGIRTLFQFSPAYSLGHLYTEIIRALGFPFYGDKGKIMALADYGTPLSEYYDLICYDYNSYQIRWDRVDDLALLVRQNTNFDAKANIAATVQQALEKALQWLVKYGFGLISSRTANLCLAGGVVYNCKANEKILNQDDVNALYVPFMPGDSGLSLGAALHGAFTHKEVLLPKCKLTPYLGPGFTDAEIGGLFDKYKIKYCKDTNPPLLAAQMLADNKIIGWFQDCMEFGPRALGNRSILAAPHQPGIADYINANVKNRAGWRPFAPSILENHMQDIFATSGIFPYMTTTAQVKKDITDKVSQVASRDGSARLQTVNSTDNPKYFALIESFHKLTGIPCILNTSINNKKQPLICHPTAAIEFFHVSGMDSLIIGSYCITK